MALQIRESANPRKLYNEKKNPASAYTKVNVWLPLTGLPTVYDALHSYISLALIESQVLKCAYRVPFLRNYRAYVT